MLNEDQIAIASFAADLAAGLNYVDKQTTNRPSQQPPALRTNPKTLITKLVQETRKVPTNQQQLKAMVEDINKIPQPEVLQNTSIAPDLQTVQITPQTITVGNVKPLNLNNVQQLELKFDLGEKQELLNTLKSIDIGIKKVLNFLNENCTKKKVSKYV